MQTYTVYEPTVGPEDLEERSGELIFVKEGFSFWAFLVPWLYLLVNRVWWGLLAYLVLTVAMIGTLTALGVGETVAMWGGFLIQLIFGFEARDLYRQALEGRGYFLSGVVSGRNLEECEYRFLQNWLPDASAQRDRLRAMASTGAPVKGDAPRSHGGDPVIGMFPAHGG